MSEYDPEALNEAEEEAEQPDETAEITDVQQTTAGEVYGDDVGFDYDPTREMVIVTAETDDGDEIDETFALPESDKSWYNPNFKLGKFKEYYDTVPKEGLLVETTVDEDSGFLELQY